MTWRARTGWMLSALATLAWIPNAAGNQVGASQATPAHVEQPYPFGYFVGDVVSQRIALDAPVAGFVPADLPGGVRVSAWFERRASRIERRDGRRWLVVEFQIVNARPEVAEARLPAWELDSRDGRQALAIPATTLRVAPLLVHDRFRPLQVGDLRPDQAPPTVPTSGLQRQLVLWSVAGVLILGAWLAWLLWRNWWAAQTQPFARAARALRGLDEASPQAWATLHRAFDATAHRVVQLDSLAVLFARAPYLAPLRPNIERFFRQSAARFYGAGEPDETVSVQALCRALRRAEKRREA